MALLESYSEKFKIPLDSIKRVFSAKSEKTFSHRTILDGFSALNDFVSIKNNSQAKWSSPIMEFNGSSVSVRFSLRGSDASVELARQTIKEIGLTESLLISELYLDSSNSFLEHLEILI